MNFLNFLTAGASLFNFNLQNLSCNSLNKNEPLPLAGEQNSEAQLEAMTKQQQLINQYMHLNIQLLNQKLENMDKPPTPTVSEKQPKEDEGKSHGKKTKKINKCGHGEKQHYAKGMCNNCYHRYGRTKKPWNCPHEKLYAGGMCQNCYINNYNKKKREVKGCKDESGAKIENDSDFEFNRDFDSVKDSSIHAVHGQKKNEQVPAKNEQPPESLQENN